MVRIALVIAAIAVAVTLALWLTHRRAARSDIVLYGNVDLRQVELPFNNTERIAAVLVQEGDRVQRGQVLARLETSRLAPQLGQPAGGDRAGARQCLPCAGRCLAIAREVRASADSCAELEWPRGQQAGSR